MSRTGPGCASLPLAYWLRLVIGRAPFPAPETSTPCSAILNSKPVSVRALPEENANSALHPTADGHGPAWDGKLSYHYVWDWRNPCFREQASCPGALLAADGDGAVIPAQGKESREETFLQVAPLLGETYTIL